MGKPVICPHCNTLFVSQNEPGNPFCLCPSCGRWMNIAPRLRTRKRPQQVAAKCPFCGTQLALGGDTCLQCHRQVITGQKLPLLQRLALVPTGKKMAVLCGTLAGLILMIVAVNLFVSWLRRPIRTGGPKPPVVAASPEEVAARRLLNELLRSRDEPNHVRLGAALGRSGPPAVPLVIDALGQPDLAEGVRRAMITALGELGDPRGAEVLAEAMADRRFQQDAMISLAMVGDPRAAQPMLQYFTERVRHAALGDALANRSLLPVRTDPTGLQRWWADHLARLRRPVAALGAAVVPELLRTYWAAWDWPPRDRGHYWLEQVQRVLEQMTLQVSINEFLESLLTDQPPDVRLACAMVLKQRRAGAGSAAERHAGMIADLLADRNLEVRRRAVWTLACLTDKSFGSFGTAQPPAEVTAEVLMEAVQWVRHRLGKEIRIGEALLSEHKPSPLPARREYHPARVEARRLVEGLAGADWPTVRARWRDLSELPPDAAPVVRRLLEGDPRDLRVPARLLILQLLAHWRDRDAVGFMGRLEGLLDNPPWMPACIACAQASAGRDTQTRRWIDLAAGIAPSCLTEKDPNKGFTPEDLGRLIAPLGRPALTLLRQDDRFRRAGSELERVYHTTVDAMIAYGWPVSKWLEELGGR